MFSCLLGESSKGGGRSFWRGGLMTRRGAANQSFLHRQASKRARAVTVLERAALGTDILIPLFGVPLADAADVALLVRERLVARRTQQHRRRGRRRLRREPDECLREPPSMLRRKRAGRTGRRSHSAGAAAR